MKNLSSPNSLLPSLLLWYQTNKRDLPWRRTRDPYAIFLSEIMLQQTTVAAVIPYYEKFLQQWPAVSDIAAASLDDVLATWAGLGYYSRARNLHKAAQHVVTHFGGVFPGRAQDLKTLPGIGAYTSGAIAAIAFGEKVAAVDGNVIRVLSRIDCDATPMPKLLKDIEARAHALMQTVPDERAGDAVQALMELGATVCIPKNPRCLLCPVNEFCVAFRENRQHELPVKAVKKTKPTRRINIYCLENAADEILLTRRPRTWMLGGMLGFPSAALTKRENDHALADTKIEWRALPDIVHHSFTHFDAELIVHAAKTPAGFTADDSDVWIAKADLLQSGLPTLFVKVAKALSV